MNSFPIYRVIVDDEGIEKISLVEDPAMELPMFCFDKDIMKFSIVSNEEHNIISCIVRTDYPILRTDGNNQPFYIVFDKDNVKDIVRRFLSNGNQQIITKNHKGDNIQGIVLQEVFIKDSEKGISPKGFEDAAEGSLFGIYHINSPELWQQCLDGTFSGVSMEIKLSLGSEISNNKISTNMSKIKEMLRSMLMSFSSVNTDKGIIFWDSDDDLKEGDNVHLLGENGENIPVEDGNYITEDGKVIEVAGSKVISIKDKEAEVASEQLEEVNEGEEVKEEVVEEVKEEIVEEVKEEVVEEVKEEVVEKVVEDPRIKAIEDELQKQAELIKKILEILDQPADGVEEVFNKTTGNSFIDMIREGMK